MKKREILLYNSFQPQKEYQKGVSLMNIISQSPFFLQVISPDIALNYRFIIDIAHAELYNCIQIYKEVTYGKNISVQNT